MRQARISAAAASIPGTNNPRTRLPSAVSFAYMCTLLTWSGEHPVLSPLESHRVAMRRIGLFPVARGARPDLPDDLRSAGIVLDPPPHQDKIRTHIRFYGPSVSPAPRISFASRKGAG
ncbi:hypothetical protein GCM10010219_60480 [Streptomyces netropsis]|nr:hypothetical protein GCM10010219_60480 [Streptomyces netropsis]